MVFGLAALGAIGIVRVPGQQKSGNPRLTAVTTNWVGCLVIGQRDSVDPISPGPAPAVVGQVEIGLRSDGVVVWREILPRK